MVNYIGAEEIVTALHKRLFVYGTMVTVGASSPIFSVLPDDGASETAYTVSEGVFH